MQEITLSAQKGQQFTVSLGGQSSSIRLHQRSTGLYMDLYISHSPIIQGVICLNCNRMVRYDYLGFSGELVFVDTKGTLDPVWDELGSRYKLFYLTAEELS